MSNIRKDSEKTNELLFSEPDHKYTLNGLVIPSVTQIIQSAGLVNFDFIPKHILERATDLGRKVHKTTEFHDKGGLNYETLAPVLKRYLDSWKSFVSDYDFTPFDIESKYYHSRFRYAGTIDRVGSSRDKIISIDIKSGTAQKTHAIQTMAYKMLYDQDKPRKEQIKERLLVYISETGYKVEVNSNPNDKNVFLAALTIHNYKKSI